MTVLTSNLKVWYGNDGEVLSEGFIYVGQPNQDPTNPAQQKTVTFQDSQGNQTTATQPLRTNDDGRIQFNGVAILALVTGDYSLYITDSEGVQINDGYIPFVEDEQAAGGDDGSFRKYGLTLNDVKALEILPGETAQSVGKITSEDELGAAWLAVNPTGNPADDIDLIDFDNGLQGKRLRNFLQPYDNLDNLTNVADARTNLDVYSTTEVDNAFQANPPAVANYIGAGNHYIRNSKSSILDVTAAMPISTTTTVGPTGSGATVIWTALDELPVNSKFVDLAIDYQVNDSVAQNGLEYIITLSGGFRQRQRIETTGALFRIEGEEHTKAQLAAGNILTVNWSASSVGTRIINIFVTGFGV